MSRSKRLLVSRLTDDEISQFPDHLISHILSYLSTKEAVKTSVLSSRWMHLWFLLPSLELRSRDFADLNTFMSFGDRFFGPDRDSCIHKLKLYIDKNEDGVDDTYPTSWFDAAAKRKIQHLHVRSYSYADRRFHKMPQRLYSFETLACLKLSRVTLDDAEFVCLPCLKAMRLIHVEFPNEATFETLVLCCPILKYMKILVASDDEKVFRVHSRSLDRLIFERLSSSLFNTGGVVIDAPRLSSMRIKDNVSKTFLVLNLDSNAILDMSLVGLVRLDKFNNEFDDKLYEGGVSSRRSNIRSFLHGISTVRQMVLSRGTFKLICLYSELEPMPQFAYVYRMCISLCSSDIKLLPTFLESFPNLNDLALTCAGHKGKYDEGMDQVSFPSGPECLLSSLEFVNFISPVSGGIEMELVKYFLKNSAILKRLTLPVVSYPNNDDIFKQLLRIPRNSTKCEVVIL